MEGTEENQYPWSFQMKATISTRIEQECFRGESTKPLRHESCGSLGKVLIAFLVFREGVCYVHFCFGSGDLASGTLKARPKQRIKAACAYLSWGSVLSLTLA